MSSRTRRWLAHLLFGLATYLAGCAVDYAEQIEPIVIEEPPSDTVFDVPDPAGEPDAVDLEDGQELPLESIDEFPELTSMCTSDYLNLRSQPSLDGQVDTMMHPNSQVTWTGAETDAEGHTWYEITDSSDNQGWASNRWLVEGECGATSGTGDLEFDLIEDVYISGYEWLDAESDYDHFGIDRYSSNGDNEITSPIEGEAVVSDECEACTESDPAQGNTFEEYDREYNWGYGAMIVIDSTYDELTDDQLSGLTDAGHEIDDGESVYIMVAHLDPNETFAETGCALTVGSELANIGNSGNSEGAHAHVEVAINDSGLQPSDDQATVEFWLSFVVDQSQSDRQGNRFDPTGIFE